MEMHRTFRRGMPSRVISGGKSSQPCGFTSVFASGHMLSQARTEAPKKRHEKSVEDDREDDTSVLDSKKRPRNGYLSRRLHLEKKPLQQNADPPSPVTKYTSRREYRGPIQLPHLPRQSSPPVAFAIDLHAVRRLAASPDRVAVAELVLVNRVGLRPVSISETSSLSTCVLRSPGESRSTCSRGTSYPRILASYSLQTLPDSSDSSLN